ncbi:tryptophan--tRNA ligase [Bacteroidetes/Chlorobi group bacterium ChocPot_Mid]|nr:MAG: tryptophan--tRNA ligase [Bacteroidetes/Chlorobi group bacterium ChocPot_Mid]
MDEKDLQKRKVILSGIQPSGKLHIGNLAGAIRNWVELQDSYDCYFTVVDLHAITVRQEPADLRKTTYELAAMLIACGLDPDKCTIFIQSHVAEHSQLAWILNCFTPIGELSRMTQFKDKSQSHADNINAGLFTYPVLQAADILLYQADLVPVGNDQKQHLELTRNIAERFNNTYSQTFVVPEPYIPPVGARIMNLQEPTKKMSKSEENEKATIYIVDSDEQIRNKIKRSVTDSGNEVVFSDDKPGIANLMSLYSLATGRTFKEIEHEFQGKGYGEFKSAVADAVADYINPIRTRFDKIIKDKAYLEKVLKDGSEKAHRIAYKTLRKVYKKIGFVQF